MNKIAIIILFKFYLLLIDHTFTMAELNRIKYCKCDGLQRERPVQERGIDGRIYNGYPAFTSELNFVAALYTTKFRTVDKIHGIPIGFDNPEYWFLCTGSVLNEDWILTAAHCLVEVESTLSKTKQYKYFYVAAGGNHNLSTILVRPENSREVKEYYKHPKYDQKEANAYYYDIGLIKVKNSFEFSGSTMIYPVCVIDEPDTSYDNIFKAGFGLKEPQYVPIGKRKRRGDDQPIVNLDIISQKLMILPLEQVYSITCNKTEANCISTYSKVGATCNGDSGDK